MLHGDVKTFDVILKKMGEESIRAVELAFEGHSLFTSGQKCNFKPKFTIGQRQISKLLATCSCCIDKRRVSKQTVGNRFEFFDFIFSKESFRGKRGEIYFQKM